MTLPTSARGEVYSDTKGLVAHIQSDVSQSTDKRFPIVASMIKEAAHPNSELRLNWIPTWAMVADA